MKSRPNWYYTQSSVIPFKKEKNDIKVLLITSRKKKKWIVPKGIVELDLSPQKSAEKEALEEAGIEGEVMSKKIGDYEHNKWGDICTVSVYPMEVKVEHSHWAEEKERKRKWFSLKDAVKKVSNKDLSQIIEKLLKYI